VYPVPDVDAVVAVAKALGIHLGSEEAVLYRKYLLEQLRAFDTFVQARVEEAQPPMVSAARTPGYRPRPEEDPLNDVLVMPTCLMTAPQHRTPGSALEAVEENLAAIHSRGSRNTQPFNYTGHPALALPVGKASAGLPVSMQLVGRFFDDPLLLRIAYAYQHATDWEAIIRVQA
jgi:Asp-tRNA(Asn)/Glu-tRNA(Gln) amidotransferase A subunit family amidase